MVTSDPASSASAERGIGLRFDARIVGDRQLLLRGGGEQLVGADLVLGRVEKTLSRFVTGIVDGREALQRRRRPQLLGRITAAFLACLRQVLGVVGPVDFLVGVRNDRDFQGDRFAEIVEHFRVERDADDQDAVDQRGEEQHRGQAVGLLFRQQPQFIEWIVVECDVGHVPLRPYWRE